MGMSTAKGHSVLSVSLVDIKEALVPDSLIEITVMRT